MAIIRVFLLRCCCCCVFVFFVLFVGFFISLLTGYWVMVIVALEDTLFERGDRVALTSAQSPSVRAALRT